MDAVADICVGGCKAPQACDDYCKIAAGEELPPGESVPQRRIIFTFGEDFADIFRKKGIHPESVSDEDWRVFEKAYFAGLGDWHEAAENAIDFVKLERARRRDEA